MTGCPGLRRLALNCAASPVMCSALSLVVKSRGFIGSPSARS